GNWLCASKCTSVKAVQLSWKLYRLPLVSVRTHSTRSGLSPLTKRSICTLRKAVLSLVSLAKTSQLLNLSLSLISLGAFFFTVYDCSASARNIGLIDSLKCPSQSLKIFKAVLGK